MGDNETVTAVIHNGSWTIQAGFAGDDAPRAVFHSVVGEKKNPYSNSKNFYVGVEVESSRGFSLSYPIKQGIVENWDEMEKIWHHTYDVLRVAPEEQRVLLTEAPTNPKINKEKMAQIMFETFNVPAMNVSNSSVLALLNSGKDTGIVLESGHEVTRVVPIYQGGILQGAVQECNFAAQQLTEHLETLCIQYSGERVANKNVLRDIRETLCYVAKDPKREMNTATDPKPFELPDGQVITIGKEQFLCPEVMFKPLFGLGMDSRGIHGMIDGSIMKCDTGIRNDLYANIVLSGGNTMYPGIESRLQDEIIALAKSKLDQQLNTKNVTPTVRVVVSPDGKNSTWIGGSKQAALPSFADSFISKKEYNESGSSIVHRKCL